MSRFLFAYRSPDGSAPGDPEVTAAWAAWFEELAPHVVDPGNPVLERRTLGPAAADTVLGGYSLVDAEDMAAAAKLAEGCPALRQGGAVEIGALAALPPEIAAMAAHEHAPTARAGA